ncbi:hypothetical protein K439DRAFT_1339617 [Ramaria rubella]|nr:hypothetical protein K439DRAFT_1339617 [Ramaria rubella]
MSHRPSPRPGTQFPFFQYTSHLSIHTLLLTFTGVFLPAGTLLITPLPPQQSSLDKPQHRLLEPITASPVWTLIWLCAGTTACLAWWAGLMREWWGTYPHQGQGNTEKTKLSSALDTIARAEGKTQVSALRNAWANTIAASLLFHVLMVLFGAPISSHVAHTYLSSLLLSILTVFVPSYALSLPSISFLYSTKNAADSQWSKLFFGQKLETAVERALVFPVFASFVGCWAGAIPIALDWDRPWQAWPLTPAYGALVGYLLGSWSSLFVNAMLFFASHDYTEKIPSVSDSTVTTKKKKKKKKDE